MLSFHTITLYIIVWAAWIEVGSGQSITCDALRILLDGSSIYGVHGYSDVCYVCTRGPVREGGREGGREGEREGERV